LERVTHVASATTLELGEGISVVFFASGDLGANGFSTGLARFKPGAQLPCHKHECGESIRFCRDDATLPWKGEPITGTV
jgi:hypothetical protein